MRVSRPIFFFGPITISPQGGTGLQKAWGGVHSNPTWLMDYIIIIAHTVLWCPLQRPMFSTDIWFPTVEMPTWHQLIWDKCQKLHFYILKTIKEEKIHWK